MKRCTVLFLALLLMLFVSGCSFKRPMSTNCDNSVIQKVLKDPSKIGSLIVLSNHVLLAKNKYSRDQAKETLLYIKSLLENDTLTFSELVIKLDPIVQAVILTDDQQMGSDTEMNTTAFAISSALTLLDLDIVINDCDRTLLNNLCDKLLTQCN